MKKLLNLFAGITLVTTGASTVVACDSTTKTNATPKVDAIIKKIVNKDVTIPLGSYANITNKTTQQLITNVLQNTNNLSATDIQGFSYNTPSDLIAGKVTKVALTIKIGSETKTINVNVVLAKTLQEQVEAFEDKIPKNLSFNINSLNPDIRNNDNIRRIQEALKSKTTLVGEIGDIANINNLPTGDFRQIAWRNLAIENDGQLDSGVAKTVTASFTISNGKTGAEAETETGSFTFQVTRSATDQQKADAVKDKITNQSFAIANNTTKTVVSQKQAIQNAIKQKYNDIDQDIINNMNFSGNNFVDGQSQTVNVTIKVGSKTVTTNITVTMRENLAEKAKTLKDKIPNTDIPLYVSGVNVDTSNASTTQAINRTLQTRTNNAITSADTNHITYSGDLNLGTGVHITGTITYQDNPSNATVTQSFTVTVLLANNNQERSIALKDKVNNTNINAGLVTDFNLSNQATQAELRKIIQENNGLTPDEANKVNFVDNDTTLSPNAAIEVTVRYGVSSNQIEGKIMVAVTKSATQEVARIKNIFVSQLKDDIQTIDGNFASFFVRNHNGDNLSQNPGFQNDLKKILLGTIGYSNFVSTRSWTQDDLNYVTFTGGTLNKNVALQVTATIKIKNVTDSDTFHIYGS